MENRIENVVMMKNVYLINSGGRAAQYGIGTYIEQMIFCLKECPFLKLIVVELDSKEKEVKHFIEEGVKYVKFPFVYTLGGETDLRRYYRSIAFSIALSANLEEESIFHFNYLHHAPLVEELRRMWASCRILITIHYLNWCFTLKGNISQFQSILGKEDAERNVDEKLLYAEYLKDKIFFKKADKIICLSKSTEKILLKNYDIMDSKLILIYNGLQDDARLLTNEECKRKKASLLFGENEKIILFVGRLDDIKGLDYLIKSFRVVLESVPEARLLVIGAGNYDEYLKACTGIWNKITFTGRLEKKELYEFYQIADVGVMPSFNEQCSYVGIEMLMHGLPLIGTDSSGLKEMIREENSLSLKEEVDSVSLPIEDMNKLILKILLGKEKNLSDFEYKRYKECYLLSDMFTKVIAVYQNIYGFNDK